MIPRERFAELREAFQALSRPEQDIFLMAQLNAMNGGEITASRRLKNKTRTNKRTFYYWDRNTPLCQKTYLNMLGIGPKDQNNHWYNRCYRGEEFSRKLCWNSWVTKSW